MTTASLTSSKLTIKVAELSRLPVIHVSIPVLDEESLLYRTLECLENQSYSDIKVYICVNQPDEWWQDPEKRSICLRNQKSLATLNRGLPFDHVIIDRSSPGYGWKGKHHGVGWARKTIMDTIDRHASSEDIIVSLDADTVFDKDYLLSVAISFINHPDFIAMSVPYFHRLTDDPNLNRIILRYEIYMRYYLLNMMRIGSPYAFTAMGSAIALRLKAYRAIGGITPKKSGEDFYFLQKLSKYGKVMCWNDEKVYPEARFSDRVFYGTGPALIRGNAGDWSGYPIFPYHLFDDIWETSELFPSLYSANIDTPVSRFLSGICKEDDPWQPLRENFNMVTQFVRACNEKLDGLRILQYLKSQNTEDMRIDESNLMDYLSTFYPPEEIRNLNIDWETFSFMASPLEQVEQIRMYLFGKEEESRFIATLL